MLRRARLEGGTDLDAHNNGGDGPQPAVPRSRDAPRTAATPGFRKLGETLTPDGASNVVRMPITDIVVLCSSNNPIDDCRTPDGFERIADDLNYGTGGRFIYLCVRRGTSAPISELEVVISSTPDADDTDAKLPKGFEKLPTNLNEGTDGGHFVYLAVKKGGPPINDVLVMMSSAIGVDDAAASKPLLYILLEGNLNHGSETGRCIRLAVNKVMRGVYSWGRNQCHQLGHEGTAPEYFPRVIHQLYNVQHMAMVSCGNEHTLALAQDGRVFTWGCGRNGRLGTAACKNQDIPVLVQTFTTLQEPSPVVFVSAGGAHSAALTKDGRAFTWGCGKFGRLGQGKLYDHYVPTEVRGGLLG